MRWKVLRTIKFTYLGVLLDQQEDGSIHLSMPQNLEDIVSSEYGAREYSIPADEHLFTEKLTVSLEAIMAALKIAAVSMLTIGEQLCRRADYAHKKNTRIEEREVNR